MFIQKRNHSLEKLDLEKVRIRIERLRDGMGFLDPLNQETIDSQWITEKVGERLYDNIPSYKIDEIVAQFCANLNTRHPDFGILASRIAINNLHKETAPKFSEATQQLADNYDIKDNPSPLVNDNIIRLVKKYGRQIDQHIVHTLDYDIDYFGYMTLSKSYLLRVNDKVVERPQYMWMRVALSIHGSDLDSAFKTYHYMSNKYFTHATPTLFHAGTRHQQLSSCFLLGTDDSVEAIYKSISDIAMISKWAGGIGIHLSNVRARGSYINSTGRYSDGIIPLMRVLNTTARYINQSGRRNGSIAVYLEPWHADIQSFLEAKKNIGNEEERARDLFYALWIPDLFMERVEQDGVWSLMCPDECPHLHNTCGEVFNQHYLAYEAAEKYRKQVKARDLFNEIINSQIETGTPYMLYKDSCNRKSNQKNLGVIKSSNLCAEIVEYSDSNEYAVCNLASIALHQFIDGEGIYDFDLLGQVVGIIVENLDKIIDINHYPVEETRRSNSRHRPVGIGVQGLADLYIKMGLPFESDEADQLNREVFETIYYYALVKSNQLAKEKGAYETFPGCPLSKGEFQFDLWGVKPTDRYDWDHLRQEIKEYGVRNSQLIALMPTASTSQILGSNECIEPYTSNLYVRRTLAGEFNVINQHLIQDLIKRGLWTDEVRTEIFRRRGSVQGIAAIPEEVQKIYKTVWEISQKSLLKGAVTRGAYVCQSQSLNIFLKQPSFNVLYSIHMYGWKQGLKTGSYYIRTAPAAEMQAFTLDPSVKGGENTETSWTDVDKDKETGNNTNGEAKVWKCTMENGCEMCGS